MLPAVRLPAIPSLPGPRPAVAASEHRPAGWHTAEKSMGNTQATQPMGNIPTATLQAAA